MKPGIGRHIDDYGRSSHKSKRMHLHSSLNRKAMSAYESRTNGRNSGSSITGRCTPDILFRHPVTVGGQLCSWLEFKDYFGFPNNPFVARSERKLGKYAIALGPGAVILSHGFQRGHPNVDMVRAFRTEDILHELPILNLATGTTNSREQLDHELQLESSDSLEADERPQEHSLCMMLADKPERDDWRVTVPSASPKQDVERPEKPAENVVRLTAP